MPRPRWEQVRRFCLLQGYTETRTDHYYHDKVLPDGSSSGTKVSFGKERQEVPPELWTRVWSRQLRLRDEGEFWRGLAGAAVGFASSPISGPATPLPAYLVRFLEHTLRYSDEQIAATSREQAQQLLNQHYAAELQE